MTCHLSSAQSCQWYLSNQFRAWDEEVDAANTVPPQDTDYGGIFDEENSDTITDFTNLHSIISQLNLGPQDTVFIPHTPANVTPYEEQDTTGGAEHGPETAGHQLHHAALANHTLDDDSDERVTVPHPHAGVVRRKESPPGLSQDTDKDGDTLMNGADQPPASRFHPFNSEIDWEIARWATRDSPGQNALDRLLSVPGVCMFHVTFFFFILIKMFQVVEKLGLSFHNVRAMHKIIDAMPDRAGKWQTKSLSFRDLPDETFTIWHRNPIEAIQGLWKDPNLSPHMAFAPSKVYTDATKSDRIYAEMWTAQWWHVLQVTVAYTCMIF